MENREKTPWQDLVSRGVQEFQRFAMVGNTTDAIRSLEQIDEVVRAAVTLEHLPKTTHLDVSGLKDRVHPHIVLRQEQRASAILAAALRKAGILPRETSIDTQLGIHAA
jgi:dihydroorotase